MDNRAGHYITQPEGYKAFIPKKLPPSPSIQYNDELHSLLSRADRSLARLDGITAVLPDPEVFVYMYVRKEAVLSSQIEGTQASLEGVLEFEADLKPRENVRDVKEIIKYIDALNFGMKELDKLPLSSRLIREIHKILVKGTRGSHRQPGEFRKHQNLIGPPGATIYEAVFVPPPPHMVENCMSDLELFFHKKDNIPPLLKIALIHAQFETIHPFMDGNGRIGRLLITFYLYWKDILAYPILYLSYYLKKNRLLYYDLLMKIRNEGSWEEWLTFFLKGIIETSNEGINTAKEIIRLKEKCISQLYDNRCLSSSMYMLIDTLFHSPLINANFVSEKLHISMPASYSLINLLEKLGILVEITGHKRYRSYIFTDYFTILQKGTEY